MELADNFLSDSEVYAFRNLVRVLKSLGFGQYRSRPGRLDSIGSGGIGALIYGVRSLRESGINIKPANLSEYTHNKVLIDVTG